MKTLLFYLLVTYSSVLLANIGAIAQLPATNNSALKKDFCFKVVPPRFMGCPVGESEPWGTPLLEAIRQRDVPLVGHLIAGGSDPNQVDSHGLSPLLLVAKGDFELLGILLSAGANANGEARYGTTPLIAAAQCSESIKRVLAAGADPNKGNINRHTPLMAAASIGNIESVKYLVKAGGDVFAIDAEGMTALLYAFKNSDIEMIRYFIEEFDEKRLFTESVLDKAMYFAILNSKLSLVEYLLTKGANVEGFDGKGNPLGMAVQKSDSEIVRLLLRKGARVNHDTGYSPIYLASLKGEVENVRLLLEAKAIVDEPRRSNYWTPLVEAARNNHIEVLKLLVGAGADVNRRAYDGKTALMYAAGAGKYEAVRFLIQNGADVNIIDEDDQATALSMATQHADIVRLLIEHGAK